MGTMYVCTSRKQHCSFLFKPGQAFITHG